MNLMQEIRERIVKVAKSRTTTNEEQLDIMIAKGFLIKGDGDTTTPDKERSVKVIDSVIDFYVAKGVDSQAIQQALFFEILMAYNDEPPSFRPLMITFDLEALEESIKGEIN